MSARLLRTLALVLLLSLALPGCQWLKLKLGIGYDVIEATVGTPEATIQQALKAALEPDAKKGWIAFRGLLHSDQQNVGSLKSWESMKYSEMRQKVRYYVTNVASTGFTVKQWNEEDAGAVSVFIENLRSDMPTPCTLMKDPKQADAWRITRCSL